MLLQKINQTTKLISEVKVKRIQQTQYVEYEEFHSKLKEDKRIYERFLLMLTLLNSFDSEYFKLIDLSEPKSKTSQLLSLLDKGEEVLKKSRLIPITTQILQFEEHLINKWKQYVNACSSEIIGTLNNMKGILEDADKLNVLIQQINVLQDSWPLTNTNLENLKYSLKQLEKIVSDVDAPIDIQFFLQLVTEKKAKLSDITPAILQWLNENNLTKTLEISFTSSPRRN